MVDRAKRDLARNLVLSLANGEITNDQFEDEYPSNPGDAALWAIATTTWLFYDDLHKHKLTGKHALTGEGRKLFERCALFLSTDLEYDWNNLVPASGLLIQLLKFDIAGRREFARLRKHGDYDVWPFRHRQDLETVQSGAADRLSTPDYTGTVEAAAEWWIYSSRMLCLLLFFTSAISMLVRFSNIGLAAFSISVAGLIGNWIAGKVAHRIYRQRPETTA